MTFRESANTYKFRRMNVICQVGVYVQYYILDYLTLHKNPT